MCSLREKLAQANPKLEHQYPESKLVHQWRGAAAGIAWLQIYEIRLNPALSIENIDVSINEVVSRKLAHLLVWKHFGCVPPRGEEWEWVTESVLGVLARCTHQLKL